MTIKNRRKNISAEPGDIVLDVTQNTLTKVNNDNDNNFSNNLILTVKQQDFINEANTSHSDRKLTIPMSEVVRIAYLVKNYYDKTTSDTRFGVTVTKQTTADSGSAVTYVVKQNGAQVGTKINIPKDFLVRSAELKTVTTKNQPVNGYLVGDKYIDFLINASDNSEINQHIYLNVKDLVDVYTADESTLTVSNNKFSIKSGGISTEQLGTSLINLINSKIDTAGTGLTKSGTKLSVNYSSALDSTSTNVAATPKAVHDAIKEAKDYTDQEILGILDPSGVVRLEIASKADADHVHGNITNNGFLQSSSYPDGTPNAIATTNSSGKIVASTTITKSKISDFAHNQASSTITDTGTYNNIGNTAQTQSGINSAINTKLGNKVDKVSGKDLSTNDFTTDFKNKLNGIESGANKYVHPTQSAITGKPTANQTPAFGSAFTISQPSVNTLGHVTSLTDRDITIPKTEASTSQAGLMSKTMFDKLSGIENGANKYIHPTQNAITGEPQSNQTPAFGGTFVVPQVVVNTLGHVTGITSRNVSIPQTVAKSSVLGLSKIINNLTTSSYIDGEALSAYQGRILNDTKWTKSPSEIGAVDFNTATTPGTYKIWAAQESTNPNAPDKQGGLLLVHEIPNGYLQILIQYYVDKPKMFYRIYHNTAGWRDWQTVLTSNTNNIEEKTIATNETVTLNYDTGMGIYSKWQGSTSISANDWWDFREFPRFGPNNDIEIETIGVSYATNNITAGASRDKIMYARIKNNKVSFFPAENTGGLIYYGAFSIPFQFRVK